MFLCFVLGNSNLGLWLEMGERGCGGVKGGGRVSRIFVDIFCSGNRRVELRRISLFYIGYRSELFFVFVLLFVGVCDGSRFFFVFRLLDRCFRERSFWLGLVESVRRF